MEKLIYKILWFATLAGVCLGFFVAEIVFWVFAACALFVSISSLFLLKEAEKRNILKDVKTKDVEESVKGSNWGVVYLFAQMALLAIFGKYIYIIPLIAIVFLSESCLSIVKKDINKRKNT